MATANVSSGKPPADARWWESLACSVNGVFKGGGAKGLLYAGALAALHERGRWFRAVAGSSAGAITATLVAAGMEPDELTEAVPTALGKMKKMYLGDLAFKPIVRTDRLRIWLEDTLRAQSAAFGRPIADGKEVTFADLYAATGIELYVVAVDVARRQPIVFSAFTTPAVAVAPAVMASSAIPLGFWPGRLKVEYEDGTSAVHRLMDGGVWANYPSFVFKDENFRGFHQLPMPPEDSVTIGFTLDDLHKHPDGRPVELLSHRRNAASDKGVSGLYHVVGWAPVRLYLFTLIPLLIALQALYTIDKGGLVFLQDWATRDGVPGPITSVAAFLDGFTSDSTLVWLLYFGVAVIALVGIGQAVLGATLLDSGIPTLRTLTAVGTNVPYWVGYMPQDPVVRLTVPAGLSTTRFRLPLEDVQRWIGEAKAAAGTQFDAIFAAPPAAAPP